MIITIITRKGLKYKLSYIQKYQQKTLNIKRRSFPMSTFFFPASINSARSRENIVQNLPEPWEIHCFKIWTMQFEPSYNKSTDEVSVPMPKLWFVNRALVIKKKKKSILESIVCAYAQTALLNNEWAFHKTRFGFGFRSLTMIPIMLCVPQGKDIYLSVLAWLTALNFLETETSWKLATKLVDWLTGVCSLIR